jgi:hypothetical protein
VLVLPSHFRSTRREISDMTLSPNTVVPLAQGFRRASKVGSARLVICKSEADGDRPGASGKQGRCDG